MKHLTLISVILALIFLPACAAPTAPSEPVFAQEESAPALAAPAADLFPGAAIRFENINIEDGLSQSVVISILHDRQGYLWFGTEDGLNRYNGYTFTIFKPNPDNPNSLSDRWINVLYEDGDAHLWIGTRLGGLNRYDPDTGTFTQYRHDPDDLASITAGSVTDITQDSQGRLWVATEEGLNRLESDGRFTRFLNDSEGPASLADNMVLALFPAQPQGLWVGTSEGLDFFDPQTGLFQHYRHDPENENSLSNSTILALAEDSYGNLWIGTGEGLNRYEPVGQKFTRYVHDPKDPASLGFNAIRRVLVDANGIVWAGTGVSLERLDPATGKFRHFFSDVTVDGSLSSDSIRALYQDREGILWVGTWGGGVNKYDQRKNQFGVYQRDPNQYPTSLNESSVFSVYPEADGTVWVGTFGGGLNRLDMTSGEAIAYRHDESDPESLANDNIWSIFRDSKGVLWVGTEGGLEKMTAPGKFQHYRSDSKNPDSLTGSAVFAIYEDRAGNLWIGAGRGLNRYDHTTGKFIYYNEGKPIPGMNAIIDMIEDETGNLWLATFDEGLYRLDPQSKELSHYVHSEQNPTSLSNDSVLALHIDIQKRLWVATAGGGLNLYQPALDSFTAYTERDCLPSDVVYGIAEPGDGALWLSTNFGISRFSPDNHTCKNYTVRDGLQSNEFNMNAFAISPDGLVFFGGIGGLTVFNPRALTANDYRPPLVLTSLSVNGSPLEILPGTRQVNIQWPQNSFEFEFAALGFSQPERTEYAYRLDNFDKDWNALGQKRDGRYTNLPGGTYTLRLKSANENGTISERFEPLTITIVPPFWQTGWFLGALAFFLLGMVYTGYRLRVRAVLHQKQELERQVTERTQEIEKLFEQTKELAIIEERNRLARELHDSAKQKAFAALAQLGTANGLIQRNPDAARTHVREAENLVHDVIQELAFLIQEMYPLALQEKGLATTLREYVFEWENRTDVRVSVNVENETRLPLNMEQAIYRITQEALANVARHSRANMVEISLVYTTAQITLNITDNGQGFDVTQRPKGVGLRSIRERAESVNGRIYIESAPGKGTRLEIVILL